MQKFFKDVYSDASQYLFHVKPPSHNAFATLQLNEKFSLNNITPFTTSNYSGPGTQLLDKQGNLKSYKPTSIEDTISKQHDLEYVQASLKYNDAKQASAAIRQADDNMIHHLYANIKRDLTPHQSIT